MAVSVAMVVLVVCAVRWGGVLVLATVAEGVKIGRTE